MRGTTYTVVILAASAPKPDKSANPLSNELIVPYWLVRSTWDKQKANMHHCTMLCTMSITSGPQSAEETVEIPILQNSRVLNEGDELFAYNEAIVLPQEKFVARRGPDIYKRRFCPKGIRAKKVRRPTGMVYKKKQRLNQP